MYHFRKEIWHNSKRRRTSIGIAAKREDGKVGSAKEVPNVCLMYKTAHSTHLYARYLEHFYGGDDDDGDMESGSF